MRTGMMLLGLALLTLAPVKSWANESENSSLERKPAFANCMSKFNDAGLCREIAILEGEVSTEGASKTAQAKADQN